jgi:hypothetical protein
MSILLTLTSMFGKPIAETLINSLKAKKDGPQRLEDAANAMTTGLTAIEALKKSFGKDFLTTLNDALGTSNQFRFSYEAGTQSYIQLDGEAASPIQLLRDELNINLDRLSVLDTKGLDIKNLFRGLVSVWKERCLQFYGPSHQADITSTITTIDNLLNGESRNYRQIYEMLSSTTLGGIGTLMVISGVFVATGTGIGVVSAISMFLFGIPWLTVGALVLPGSLLVILAAKKTRPIDEISLAIAMSYKLLGRLEKQSS